MGSGFNFQFCQAESRKFHLGVVLRWVSKRRAVTRAVWRALSNEFIYLFIFYLDSCLYAWTRPFVRRAWARHGSSGVSDLSMQAWMCKCPDRKRFCAPFCSWCSTVIYRFDKFVAISEDSISEFERSSHPDFATVIVIRVCVPGIFSGDEGWDPCGSFWSKGILFGCCSERVLAEVVGVVCLVAEVN